jgi:hypothetical protein
MIHFKVGDVVHYYTDAQRLGYIVSVEKASMFKVCWFDIDVTSTYCLSELKKISS